MAFVHLHTHSEYSLLDGASRIPELVKHVKKLGQNSLAITDHGNMHGAWSFYDCAKKEGIRPILGFEAYLAYGPRTAREKPANAPGIYSHLVLLARDRAGYKNLARLSSIGYVEGFYRRPRIDKEVLEQHSEGLVGLAACLSGEIAMAIRLGRWDDGRTGRASDGIRRDVRRHRLYLPCASDPFGSAERSGDGGYGQADPHLIVSATAAATVMTFRRASTPEK